VFLEVNTFEEYPGYLSLKFLSEYFFIRLLDSFPVLLVLFFSLFVSVIFICYLFLFIFRADPPEPQQGRAGRQHC